MPGGFGDLQRINHNRDAEAQGEARLSQSKNLGQTDRKEKVEESEIRANWLIYLILLAAVIAIIILFIALFYAPVIT